MAARQHQFHRHIHNNSGLPSFNRSSTSSHNNNGGVYNKKLYNHNRRIAFCLISFACCFFGVGIFFSFSLFPKQSLQNGFSNPVLLNSGLLFEKGQSLKQKILSWLPESHRKDHEENFSEPDWSQEFWTPIDLDVQTNYNDHMVTLCRLNFQKYSDKPHQYAMFRDLVTLSGCTGDNRKRDTLVNLMNSMKSNKGFVSGRHISPTGFVFHESRVGSTLIANNLASDPWSLVFSESAPAANALIDYKGNNRTEHIQLFRDIVNLMGSSPFHKRLFFKFQSITTTKIDIALEAFPNTPWTFVYRSPVQTMMSHLDPRKGATGAPCLRSKRSPPIEVMTSLGIYGNTKNLPNEAWCAAHLNMLCSHAMEAYSKYNTMDWNGKTLQRAFLVNYESLPGIIPHLILPMFGVGASDRWLSRMMEESKQYSKGKSKSYVFLGDSEDKEEHASDSIEKYANEILEPTYQSMLELSYDGMKKLDILPTNGSRYDWTLYHDIPSTLSTDSRNIIKSRSFVIGKPHSSSDESYIPHSVLVDSVDFLPWAPFANTHSSRPFENIDCPAIPAEGYPKAYPIMNLLNNWNADSTEIPEFHFDALCHFDYQNETQFQMIYAYRKAEVPFVAYNIPEVDEVVKKWNDVEYLQQKLGKKWYRSETSKDNHFMYWRNSGIGNNLLRNRDGVKWSPPTDVISLTFEEWLENAVKGQNKSLEDRKHQYFRVSTDIGSGNEWLFDELPFFKPKPSLFIVDPKEQRGIHCRFGMRSVIAEAHFDGARNSVVMFGGLRRWILTHPNQCKHMYMLPPSHPSGRHSECDWSKPDLEKFPDFANVHSNEVILQPGDFLYVPTYWIHYIVSLNVNYQCNTRSGKTNDYDATIHQCGF